ncbi:MAG: hypothetical protein OXC11_10090 [Rhodospirillales bacterium]|nr:hypothetical protein [Rhodospirillales bacterium]
MTEEQRRSAMDKNTSHWEGKVLSYSFENMDKWFNKPEEFVPSGLLQILCWLELGAPGLDRKWWRPRQNMARNCKPAATSAGPADRP